VAVLRELPQMGLTGGSFTPRYEGVREISYLFVDGACLNKELLGWGEDFGDGEPAQIDYNQLAAEYTKVFYYDAIPAKKDAETDGDYDSRIEPTLSNIKVLRELDKYHVYEGDQRRASNRKERPEQKKVDVLIAVDMLLHTVRRNMHKAALLTGDRDFVPLIQALVREGMDVSLLYPMGVTHEELIASADHKVALDPEFLRRVLKTDQSALVLPTQRNERHAPQGLEITETIQTQNGRSFDIYNTSDRYVARQQPEDPRFAALQLEHTDCKVLRCYLEQQYGKFAP
jgi:uncharacterized LabA/DUF88 family protein